MAKAKIQKLKEDMLLREGSKDTILPITVDKAVHVKKRTNKYEPLSEVLPRKWETAWEYTVKTSDNEDAYYLISFSSNANKEAFKKLMYLSNTDFEKEILNKGTQEDIDNITYEFSPSIAAYTEEDFLRRIEYDYVNEKYLNLIKLHTSSKTEFVVFDDDGNIYKDGDVIYSDTYPKTLYLSTRGITNEYIHSVNDIITNFSNYKDVVYGVKFNSVKEELAQEILETKVVEASYENNFGLLKPNVLREFKNPLLYYKDYHNDYEFNITAVNSLISYALKGYIKFEVMPASFPKNYTSESIAEYESQARYGYITISDECTLDGQNIDLVNRINPFKLKVVFNPNQNFMFTSPEYDSKITLKKNNKFTDTVKFSALFAEPSANVTISFGDEVDSNYAISDSSGLNFGNTITINGRNLNNGYDVIIRPKNWSSEKDYVPFDTPKVETVYLYCTYEDAVNEVVRTLRTKVECIVTNSDMPVNLPTLTPVVVPYDDQTKVGYIECNFTNLTSDSTYSVSAVDALYRGLSGNGINTTLIPFVPDIKYSNTKENGEFINYVTLNVGKSFSEEELNEGLKFKITIPSKDSMGNTLQGKGYVVIYLIGNSGNNAALTLPFEYDLNSITQDQENLYEEVYRIYGTNPSIVAVDVAHADLINRIKDKSDISPTKPSIVPSESETDPNPTSQEDSNSRPSIKPGSSTGKITVITEGELNSVTKLEEGVFRNTEVQNVDILKSMPNLTAIPEYAFEGNDSLVTAIIPEGIKEIGREAFANCPNLTTIVFPNSCESIDSKVAINCPNLRTIICGDNLEAFPVKGFIGCPNIRDIYIQYEVIESGHVVSITHSPVGLGINYGAAFDSALNNLSELRIHVTPAAYTDLGEGIKQTFWGNHFSEASLLPIQEGEIEQIIENNN